MIGTDLSEDRTAARGGCIWPGHRVGLHRELHPLKPRSRHSRLVRRPDFALDSLDGQKVSLSALADQGPVVLVVLRGYPGYQCPICTAQVGELMGKAREFQDARSRVILVYPGPSEGLKQRAGEFIRGKTLPENFQILLDPDYTFTKSYGLRWDAPKETAYPSAFVIDSMAHDPVREDQPLTRRPCQSGRDPRGAQEVSRAAPRRTETRSSGTEPDRSDQAASARSGGPSPPANPASRGGRTPTARPRQLLRRWTATGQEAASE